MVSDIGDDDLLDEVLFEQLPRGRKPDPNVIDAVVRPLTLDDLAAIAEGHLDHSAPPLQNIRETHHALARAIARGCNDVEASAITGYAPGTITRYRRDPAFAELVVVYQEQETQIVADTIERMRMLGLSSMDELQARLEEDPRGWTKRELMEMAKMCLIEGKKVDAGHTPVPGGGAATVNIKFVQAPQVGPTVEITPNDPSAVLHLQGDQE